MKNILNETFLNGTNLKDIKILEFAMTSCDETYKCVFQSSLIFIILAWKNKKLLDIKHKKFY